MHFHFLVAMAKVGWLAASPEILALARIAGPIILL